MAIMSKFLNKKQKELFSTPISYTRLSDEDICEPEVRKGYIPVMVGEEEGVRMRFLIPTHIMSHPVIVSLLELSAEKFGYRQEGVLRIPHDPDCFREILRKLSL